MEVYARVMFKDTFKDMEVYQDLGIVIIHKGNRYTISENNSGTLVLRSIDSTQLVLLTKAANLVEIRSEK